MMPYGISGPLYMSKHWLSSIPIYTHNNNEAMAKHFLNWKMKVVTNRRIYFSREVIYDYLNGNDLYV